MNRWFRPLALVVCTACILCEAVYGDKASHPNIVLFYVDDLGWSDLGYSGSSFYESPNIDRLANEGVVFDNAYACAPNCAPLHKASPNFSLPETWQTAAGCTTSYAAKMTILIGSFDQKSPARSTLHSHTCEARFAASYTCD